MYTGVFLGSVNAWYARSTAFLVAASSLPIFFESGIRSRIRQCPAPVIPCASSTNRPMTKHAPADHASALRTFGSCAQVSRKKYCEQHDMRIVGERTCSECAVEGPLAIHRSQLEADPGRKVQQRRDHEECIREPAGDQCWE